MEAIQCSETTTQSTVIGESSRVLKRNIGELAIDGKINEDFKSPARKEVKVCHETILRRELEQWKQLMTEHGIRQSVLYSDQIDTEKEITMDILEEDQKNFIAGAIDVEKMSESSREFRRKFDFFVRANRLALSLANEKSLLALDKGKQQSIKIRTESKLCGIPPFYSPTE